MHPAELAILLHRALEVRLARLQELLEKNLWVEDAELLHQVRVAARRLGAVLDLVDSDIYPGHKGHRRALKNLVDILGLTREQDVHADQLETHHQAARTSTQAAVIEHLLDRLDRSRAKARRTMLKELERLRLPDLRRLLEVPALKAPFQPRSMNEAVWGCLAPRSEVALDGLTLLAAHEDPAAMHKARVRIKKLRYALEAVEGAFLASPEPVLKGLRDLQMVLGDHHDLATLEAMLWETESRLRLRGRLTLCGGVLDLLGEVAESRRLAFDRFVTLTQGQDPGAFVRVVRPALGLSLADGSRA
jgi:CHAD domain-containing protein